MMEQIKNKKDIVVLTVIADSGSVPRGAGARMWVAEDGKTGGTIGGGRIEHLGIKKAQVVLKEKKSHCEGYNLGENGAADIGMVCGGEVIVFFQYISWEDKKLKGVFERIIFQCEQNENAWMIMDITDTVVNETWIHTTEKEALETKHPGFEKLLKNKPIKMKFGDRTYYAEPLIQEGMVYVFGGGHVAKALVSLLDKVGFSCVVLDDREEFLTEERFPTAKNRIRCDFKNIQNTVSIGKSDYVVIMTRGHQYDYEIQSQALVHKPYYLGVMGSKRKVRVVTEKLMADGYSKDEIEHTHMPIGLSINAETPEEIAVSIVAEMIAVRADKKEE